MKGISTRKINTSPRLPGRVHHDHVELAGGGEARPVVEGDVGVDRDALRGDLRRRGGVVWRVRGGPAAGSVGRGWMERGGERAQGGACAPATRRDRGHPRPLPRRLRGQKQGKVTRWDGGEARGRRAPWALRRAFGRPGLAGLRRALPSLVPAPLVAPALLVLPLKLPLLVASSLPPSRPRVPAVLVFLCFPGGARGSAARSAPESRMGPLASQNLYRTSLRSGWRFCTCRLRLRGPHRRAAPTPRRSRP